MIQSASSCRLLLTEGRPQAVGRRQAVQITPRWLLSEGVGERAALLHGACWVGLQGATMVRSCLVEGVHGVQHAQWL